MACPKCAFEVEADALECPSCGVIFSKLARDPRLDVPSYTIEEERVADGRIGRSELRILGFALAAAIVAYAIPFTRWILSALVTLFHELGHAVAGWLLGYPSLPAFDLVYGGGLTHHGPFRLSIAIAVSVAFAYLMWLFRENKKSMTIIAVLFLLWLFIVTKEWRREIAFASAGHLSEFVLAGIFFYKALSGAGWKAPDVERPAGAFVAFFVQIHSTLFAWRLTRDPAYLDWYKQGKGGAMMNDLEVVALDLHIWLGISPEIEGLARALLVFSLVPIVVGLVWYVERARWHRLLRSLRTAEG